jgi:hypothetical protein
MTRGVPGRRDDPKAPSTYLTVVETTHAARTGPQCGGNNAGDLGPYLEGVGSGGSILGGGEVIAAEKKQVADLIVGREEALCLAG